MFWYGMMAVRFKFNHNLIYSVLSGTLVFWQRQTNARMKHV